METIFWQGLNFLYVLMWAMMFSIELIVFLGVLAYLLTATHSSERSTHFCFSLVALIAFAWVIWTTFPSFTQEGNIHLTILSPEEIRLSRSPQ